MTTSCDNSEQAKNYILVHNCCTIIQLCSFLKWRNEGVKLQLHKVLLHKINIAEGFLRPDFFSATNMIENIMKFYVN